MVPSPDARPDETQISEQVLTATYAVVAARRTAFDTMTWQVPALATAAQAFLLTLALGPETARPAQAVAATLAAALTGLSAQLMIKYRRLELSDSRLLERIEQQLGLDQMLGLPPHSAVRERLGDNQPWWVRLSSFRLWLLGVAAFSMADVVIAIDALAGLELFR
ncbi:MULTISPECIES: hypothetical protein [Micromonospora]|uniref:hypothetical protein n=1 Tax=Micromonospora TaxID=1873 RepID=UPI001EE9A69D|nr:MULTISPECIES: hypothetical protein [Micromonospora]MCG5451532.1 hypothetical protein [Micromonospora hortensis]MCX5116745.1 hypothetical protein [Micromonospora sp. NBC_00362]WTI11121.1 hypothetical protein OHB44_16140 [Micromonospora sp. NBC_00821]